MGAFAEWLKEKEADKLHDLSINEMAFSRAEIKEKLEQWTHPLMDHILCLMSFKEESNWNKTVTNILVNINNLYKIKAHRKYLSKETILDTMLYGPFEDTDDEWIEKDVIKLSKKGMKINKIPTFKEIELIYEKLVHLALNDNFNKADILKLIKN